VHERERDFLQVNDICVATPALPYSVSWSNVAPGSYSLTARATDNLGAVTNSAANLITGLANQLPSVSLTSPTAARLLSTVLA
jgi:hypothetical protein